MTESNNAYSLAELMICAAAEAFAEDGEVLATGIGVLQRLAASLAMAAPQRPFSEAVAFANRFAALCTEGRGAALAMPHRADVLSRFQA